MSAFAWGLIWSVCSIAALLFAFQPLFERISYP